MKVLCWLKRKIAITSAAFVLCLLGLGLALFLFLKTLSGEHHGHQEVRH